MDIECYQDAKVTPFQGLISDYINIVTGFRFDLFSYYKSILQDFRIIKGRFYSLYSGKTVCEGWSWYVFPKYVDGELFYDFNAIYCIASNRKFFLSKNFRGKGFLSTFKAPHNAFYLMTSTVVFKSLFLMASRPGSFLCNILRPSDFLSKILMAECCFLLVSRPKGFLL